VSFTIINKFIQLNGSLNIVMYIYIYTYKIIFKLLIIEKNMMYVITINIADLLFIIYYPSA